MSSTFRTLGQSELLPRYIFAESLYARRRVLEIGAVASTLGQSARFLATRGARIVVAADADLSAVQDAQARLAGPNLRFRAPVFDDLEAGSFDLVIVADLAPYVFAPELLKDLVRLVAKTGYIMGGLRNPAGLSLANVMEAEGRDAPPTYGQLLDALSVHFRSIEVATQSPVLGYQLAFEKGEGLQVDGSLAGSSEAAYYVVLAGHEPVRFFDPTWVQLPPEPLAFTGGKLEDASTRARNWQERSDRLKDALQKTKDEAKQTEDDLKVSRAQLESAREAVARLTAQLESVTLRPRTDTQSDELTAKVRRLEAELTVARERASDAEGRVAAMRAEVELHQREQKHATIETLAAQESSRLERNRREELGTQLTDARSRLTKAYEELRTAQDEAAAARVETERARLETSRIAENLAAREREVATAREKELRLAQAQSEAQSAVESLQRQLDEATKSLRAADDALTQKEAERHAAFRAVELEEVKREQLKTEVQNLTAKVSELADELQFRSSTLTATETELEGARADKARLQRDIETLSSSERTWREHAQQFESRLNDTLANVTALSDQVAKLEAEKDQEQARFRRLEADLTTAVGAERSAREQAEVSLADAKQAIEGLNAERRTLLDDKDALKTQLDEASSRVASSQRQIDELTERLEKAHDEAARRLQELTQQLTDTSGREAQAQSERDAARAELARLEGQLHQGRERVAELAQKAARLEGEAAAFKAKVAELEGLAQERLDRLQSTAEQLRALEQSAVTLKSESTERAGALEAEVASLTQRLTERETALTAELETARSSGDRLTHRLVERERQLEQLRDSLAATENARARLEELVLADRKEHAEVAAKLEAQLSEAKDELARRAQAATELKAEVTELTREVELTRERSGLEREALQQAVAQRLALEEKLREVEGRLSTDLEARTAETLLRERVEKERDALREEAKEAAQWVVGGKAENERLSQQLNEVRADLERLQAELSQARAEGERTQRELDAAQAEAEKQRSGRETSVQAAEEATGQLKAARTELSVVSQQLVASKQEVLRSATETQNLRSEVAALQRRFDEKAANATAELAAAKDAHHHELLALNAQLDTVKGELASVKTSLERAQSEARGHQAGKLQLQSELDTARAELTQAKAAVAEAGGETKAIADARQSAEVELKAMQSRAEAAEAERASNQARLTELEAELAQVKEREKGFSAQLEQLQGAAHGSSSELDAAVAGKKLAEEMLLKMRTKYGELEAQLAELMPLREQLRELDGHNQMLDTERERLASQVERLESTKAELESRLQATHLQLDREKSGQVETLYTSERERAELDAQLKLARAAAADEKQKGEHLERRLKAQEIELAAFRRRAAPAPATTQPIAPPAVSGGARPLPPRPSATGPAPKAPVAAKPGVPAPGPTAPAAPSGAKPLAPKLTPGRPGQAKAPTAPESIDLEVFELDVDDDTDTHELLDLDDEASRSGGKDPKKG